MVETTGARSTYDPSLPQLAARVHPEERDPDIDTYFDSGRYWQPPRSIGAFMQTDFSRTSGDPSILTGVAGGPAFRVVIDEATSVHYDVAVGWSSPLDESPSVSFVPSSHGIDGFMAVNPKGGSFTDDTVYEAQDRDGRPVRFKLHFSSTVAGQ
ncbi:hypothetical protein BN946_scf185000.g47 [Trametes cinnabarina]|uniref:Uncharacterized protein n=1 Tax=Pycnoporus cinnabarinus TaxID=5643 RepID=A0A060S9F6_PYCCI|nr:hypothetical protein BN946_scf185000.g47 [Trametes cinnabarina]